MATPTGRLTRGTIITQAQRRAGNASTSLKREMRTWLNLELQDLYSQWDWPFLVTSTTLTLSGATFPLPTDFLRTADSSGLQITSIDGVARRFLRIPELDPQAFWQRYDPDTVSTTPLIWTADRTNDVGRLWPQATAAVTAQLRYKRWVADVDEADETTYDADSPIFPWHSYLIEKMYAKILEWDRDTTAMEALLKAEEMLRRIRGVALPPQSVALTVELDQDTFLPTFSPETE